MRTSSPKSTLPPIFVINLETRTDRWRFQQIQAALFRLNIQRFVAIDAVGGSNTYPASTLTGGALGLWATFASLCTELAEANQPAAVVLEDDAVLGFGFKRRLRRIVEATPPSTAMVQLGYLVESSWRPNRPPWQNVRSILRPRSRLRRWVDRSKSSVERGLIRGDLKSGTHALLIYPEMLVQIMKEVDPASLPLDMAFVKLGANHPDSLFRARRTLAHQLPFKSDIPWRNVSGSVSVSAENLSQDSSAV